MPNKVSNFFTGDVEVKWSHLHKPDDKFGADTSNHNITVVVDSDLRAKMDEIQQTLGAKKINGMREDDGVTLLKAKTKTYAKKNVSVFPCVDAKANSTEAVPFGGDKVRLKLAPIMIDRDNSLSFFLNGVQIIEKNDSPAAASGFEVTDGFDGSSYQATHESQTEEIPNQQEDDIPF
tara:strand:- start:553 stop:1083 length:531 start_codon:yes stop_codon:yes gene_type:complete